MNQRAPVRAPSNRKEAKDLRDRLNGLRERFNRFHSDFTIKSDRIRSEIAQRVASISDPKRRKDAENLYAEEQKDRLAELRKSSADARRETLEEISEIRNAIRASAAHIGDAVVQASLHGLGTEKRSRIAAELEHAGPAVLRSVANQAMLTGDKDMAAAAIARNARIDAKQRLFDNKQLADSLWGADVAEVAEIAATCEHMFDSATAYNREIDGEPLTPTEKIAAGLKHGGKLVTPPVSPSATRDPTLLERMREALDVADAA